MSFVKSPGYAYYPRDEVVPTLKEAATPLFDLSDFDNVRWRSLPKETPRRSE